MNPLLHGLGWTFLHFLWQGALVAGLVAVALWLLTGRDSRLRYAVACAGLLVMVALPVATFSQVAQPARPAAAGLAPARLVQLSRTARVVPPASPGRSWSTALEPALPALVGLWLLGSLAMATRLTGGWLWLQWLRRRPETQPAPDAPQLQLLRLCQRMRVASNLRLLLCTAVPGPTVLGWLKPVILIPPALLSGLSPQHLELILAHELAHVLRHDYLINLLQSVAEVLLFFHPALWWLSRKIRQEREQACDDLAVRLYGDALDYAQALTRLEALAARQPSNPPAPRLALAAQGGPFMARIHRLLSPIAPTRLAPRAGLVVFLLLAAGYALQSRAQSPVPAGTPALPRGAVLLRRYDAASADGHCKAGTIDLRAEATTQACIERGLAQLQVLPPDPDLGYVDLVLLAKADEPGSRWTYKFTGTDPARVVTIIRSHAAQASIVRKPGLLTVLRTNSFTYQGAPLGRKVHVWAGEVPADLVLQALNDLEAMPALAGVPQEVRREIAPGEGTGPTVSIDLQGAEPEEVRAILTKALGKG